MSRKRCHQETVASESDPIRWEFDKLLQTLAASHKTTRPTLRRTLFFVVNAVHLIPQTFDLPQRQGHPVSEYASILICHLLSLLLQRCKYPLLDMNTGRITQNVLPPNLSRYQQLQCVGLEASRQWTGHTFIQQLHNRHAVCIDENILMLAFKAFCIEYLVPGSIEYFERNADKLFTLRYAGGLTPCCRMIPSLLYWASPYPQCSYEVSLSTLVMSHHLKQHSPMTLHYNEYYDTCMSVTYIDVIPRPTLTLSVTGSFCAPIVKAPSFSADIQGSIVTLMTVTEHCERTVAQQARILKDLEQHLIRDVAWIVLGFMSGQRF